MSDSKATEAERQLRLKDIIRRLHAGVTVAEVKRDFGELIRGVSAEEIASMEQALLDEGFPVEEVQRLCEVHVAVFESALKTGPLAKNLRGHPARSLSDENRAASARLRRLKAAARAWLWAVRLGRGAAAARLRDEAAALLADLSVYLIHYVRKENQLFPFLERHGFTGPSRVMWGKHDEIRSGFKEAEAALAAGAVVFSRSLRSLAAAMRRMIFMEERILIPNALKRLDEREWAQIRAGEEAIGFAWIKPGAEYDAGIVLSRSKHGEPAAGAGPAPAAGTTPAPASGIELRTGALPQDLLDLTLRSLPLDISVVDENDRVLYYSDSAERLFPRSPAVIGRAVQNCHPQKSLATVERILQAFKRGERDRAKFWIQMGPRLVVIEYLALRDAEGNYRGTLEMSQDATPLRSLEGERRLLDWD